MLRVGLIGLGKMGLSHLAMIKAHPKVSAVVLCDSSPIIPDLIGKFTGSQLYSDYKDMFSKEKLDAVFIATPTQSHGPMVRAALEKNIHVFCEKPFCLDPEEGRELAELAKSKGLVNQVGYHYRFVGAFQEAKRQLASGILGRIHHVRAEAYGPVVLRPKGSTWRTSKGTGGGCLYDYACHVIDLVTYLVGTPQAVGGTVLNKIFSRDVEDEVYSTLYFADGATGQLAANWSDESYRKMYAKITVWGEKGRMNIDRQEIQTYLRSDEGASDNQSKGWNVAYTTELTDEVWYYLRGEEYSQQIDHFIQCILEGGQETMSPFDSAVATDTVVAMMLADAAGERPAVGGSGNRDPEPTGGFWRRVKSSIS
jgi:predicted dehydrogenase